MTVENIVDSIVSPETTGQPIQQVVKNATALLGYVAGNSWPTYEPFRRARPDLAAKGWVLPVSLTCLIPRGHKRAIYDIEPHGGENRNIGIFASRVDRSVPFGLYTFASNGEAMLAAAKSFGLRHGKDFFIVIAHPGTRHGKHLCSPATCGTPFTADMTQWLFAGSFDSSIARDGILPATPKPRPVRQASGKWKAEITFDPQGNLGEGHYEIHGIKGANVRMAEKPTTYKFTGTVDAHRGPWTIHRNGRTN